MVKLTAVWAGFLKFKIHCNELLLFLLIFKLDYAGMLIVPTYTMTMIL